MLKICEHARSCRVINCLALFPHEGCQHTDDGICPLIVGVSCVPYNCDPQVGTCAEQDLKEETIRVLVIIMAKMSLSFPAAIDYLAQQYEAQQIPERNSYQEPFPGSEGYEWTGDR
jgi:hypothetical protein